MDAGCPQFVSDGSEEDGSFVDVFHWMSEVSVGGCVGSVWPLWGSLVVEDYGDQGSCLDITGLTPHSSAVF